MIWFFLAGMIAGAVGVVMYAGWWINRHATVMKITGDDVENPEKREE